MPRSKSIPPSEPLPPALQERVVAFKAYTNGHARLAQVDDALTQAIWEPGGFAFLLLYGPTGVGKSVLLRSVTSRMQARAQVVTPGDKLPRPVILVETPAPFTYREWYERVLLALDETIIEERVYREVGGAASSKGTIRGRASAKLLEEAPELRRAVEVALAKRRVQAILLDEAQHLLASGETGELKRRWDWLKSLTNTTGVLHVLAGAYPLLQFRLVSGQAARRGTDLHFPRYQLTSQEDCAAFQGALLALLKPACRAVSGREVKTAELQRLMDHWPLFYAGCLGCVGVLKEWLIRAVSAALRKGDAQLTLERVREYELIEARRSQMATDIVAGEQQVAFTGDAHTHLNSLLQMDAQAGSPPTQATGASAAPPRRASTRPGTRKPKRDVSG